MTDTTALLVLAMTAGVFAFLIPFAVHRTWLLHLSARTRSEDRAPWPEADLPTVTVQLPMYDERAVAARAIDAACSIDYPPHLLEVQVLDDSDDETTSVVADRLAHWAARGVRVRHVRRDGRAGFKAGALAHGTELATGEFLLVLDADFVPGPSLVRELLAPMRDARVGMVQAAWDHLGRTTNWLTEAQSFLLDGHFCFEQGGRYRGDRFFNFNGTAGLWRRTCLEDAGGWQADTLTEDLDLSYRAQMAGWRFVYLDDVRVPAEIPDTVAALEVQQRRWAQGGVQTGRKILPRLLSGPWPIAVKFEAVVHLFGHLAHPLTWSLALLLFPSAVARRTLGLDSLLVLDLVLFGLATVPFVVFYWLAGEARGRPRRGRLRAIARTLALGIGLSVPISRAVMRGLRSLEDPFVRTPKRGDRPRPAYDTAPARIDAGLKLFMAAVMTLYLVAAVIGRYWGQLPFIILFLSGYLSLGLPSFVGAGVVRSGGTSGAMAVDDEQNEERRPERQSGSGWLGPLTGQPVFSQPVVADECEAS